MDITTINEYINQVELSEKKVLRHASDKIKVGVDLGTAYIVIMVLDENNKPIAYEKRAASVLRDGVVVDYIGAQRIVSDLKTTLENRIERELNQCCIAMPPGTENSAKTHIYVVEGAGFEVIRVLDEPSAANALYNISDGVIADIGGGTTGLAVFRDGKVISIADEPTGGVHLTLVLAGNMGIPLAEAERIKMDQDNHKKIFNIIKPVVEKMASIVKSHTNAVKAEVLYLCGGTCCLTGIEQVFENELGITVIKPDKPLLITPIGIAMNCFGEEEEHEGGKVCSLQL